MFTGIVAGRGRVVEMRESHLGVEAPTALPPPKVSGSIAINGVCLTVVGSEGRVFFADVVPETRRRTNLGKLRPGDEVNLEAPLHLDQGLDGHLVQGHVDGTAEVLEVSPADQGRELTIELPAPLAPYVAEKGSVAVDGVSLTVAGIDAALPPARERTGKGVGGQSFRVALIPHTLRETIAGTYRQGTVVNLEVDVVARYVERMLRSQME
jgi:riboflavin synthase